MKKMKKEQVLNAIAHKQTDKIPHIIELTSEKQKSFCDFVGIDTSEFFDYAGNCIQKLEYGTGEYIRDGFYQDNYGVIWNRSGIDKDIGVVTEELVTEENYLGFKFPTPDIDRVKSLTQTLISDGRDTVKLGKIGMTLFERAWSLRGMENLLTDFYLNPELAHHLLGNICDYNLQIIDAALEFDIDGFYFGDDYGQQTGLMMSPDTWREFIKPYLKKMFTKVKSRGKIVALHCCGNITDILGDLIEIGLDIYQTVQPELYNLAELKENFGKDLSFWGAISTQRDMPFVSPDQLVKIMQETIDILGKDGGYIVAPTHQVPPDVPNENIAAFINYLKG